MSFAHQRRTVMKTELHHSLQRLRAFVFTSVLFTSVVFSNAIAADSSEDNAKSEQKEREQRVSLAKHFLVPDSHIEQLRSKSMSWDDIFKALAVAQKISRTAPIPI